MKKTLTSKQPLISIIIPTYNSADTFETSLKSVLKQEFVEKEIIIIDGGSTDGTVDLIKQYENQIDIWISEPDNGIYDALNKGIDVATGEWLYFLGSDDKLYDSHVFADIPFHKTRSRMIYGNVILENDGVIGMSGSVYDGLFDKYKLAMGNICHQAIFYKKELYVELGKYDARYPILADWVFNMRAFASKNTHPTFINRIIAIYANKGSSDKEIDKNYAYDRATLVKTYLGLKVYYFTKFTKTKTYKYAIRLLRK